MCSAPAKKVVSAVATVANPVAAFANLGGFGAAKSAIRTAKAGGNPMDIAQGALGGAAGSVSDPVGTVTGKSSYAPPDEVSSGGSSTPDAGPPPTPTPSNPTESAAMAAKRRLMLMRMGLLSTITTGGAGVTTPPSILTPSAGAGSPLKAQLGQ